MALGRRDRRSDLQQVKRHRHIEFREASNLKPGHAQQDPRRSPLRKELEAIVLAGLPPRQDKDQVGIARRVRAGQPLSKPEDHWPEKRRAHLCFFLFARYWDAAFTPAPSRTRKVYS